MTNDTEPRRALMYPVPEAARMLGIGRTKTFDLLRTGELHSVQVGRRRLVPAAALNDYVEKLQGENHSADAA